MTIKLPSLIAAAALVALVQPAQAGEPVALNDNQMDQVTAGFLDAIEWLRWGGVPYTAATSATGSKNHEKVSIAGFGVFETVHRPAKDSR